MKKNLVAEILLKVAPKIGAKIFVEPEWGVVGQINFKNGQRRYFRWSSLDINTLGASEVAKDKDYSNFFLKQMGYSTIPSEAFYSEAWAKAIGSKRGIDTAYAYAQKLGFPVIVKPNSLSQGNGVTKVHTKSEFCRVMRLIFKKDRVVLVQKFIEGEDYRIVVLDDKVISAYRRIPLNVVGDGKSTIDKLLKQKQKQFEYIGRDTILDPNDIRIKMRLARLGLDFRSIPPNGSRVFLLDNANLSSGGDSVDVTDTIHKTVANLAIKITKDMGLRFCGVDIMIPKGRGLNQSISVVGEYVIIEINSAPGLDHYASIGKKQAELVERLYSEVLRAMGKKRNI